MKVTKCKRKKFFADKVIFLQNALACKKECLLLRHN